MSETVKILVIDDHRIFADGLSLMLQQLDDSFSVETFYTARSIIANLDELVNYDLVLIDLNMPNLSGADFLTAVASHKVVIPTIIISGSEELNDVERCLRLGARGFIPKSLPSIEVVAGVKKVLTGSVFLPTSLADTVNWSRCNPQLDKHSIDQKSMSGIRPRQIEVLSLMSAGHSNSKIATILGISESAIKSHISIIFKALNVKNRTTAVKVALKLELINSDT